MGVHTGSDSNLIVIDVALARDERTLFVWDVENNIEISNFDVENDYDLMWDNNG